jgi:putative ABC transport system permease protein
VSIGGQGGEEKFKVTGVFNASLGKSHIMPEFFMTMNSSGIGEFVRTDDSWAGNNFIYSYLRLRPGADGKALEAKLPAFLQRHGATQLAQLNMKKNLFLQPVAEIHTAPQRMADIAPGVSSRFLNILLLIAGFIMLVACINFMNLTTARSTRRAQEVGVRKAIGAPRSALIGQFLGESMVLAFLAVLLAIPVVVIALPYLNHISGASVALDFTQNWAAWGMVGGLVLLTGVLAGSYPAFYLSSFKPVAVLRGIGTVKSENNAIWLRKGLVVSQFVIASALIIGAIVIRYQLNYMLTTDLGFEKSQKIIFQFRTLSATS